jgi:small subunit ribosomal protein S15
MARLHSRKKGKSGSEKPVPNTRPSWVKVSKEEAVEVVRKLSKEGMPPALIGMVLRDEYGVPSVKKFADKTISQILREEKLLPEYPPDLIDLIRRAVNVRTHLKQNPHDVHNKVKLVHIESKIKRLVRYYRKKGRLPRNWVYEPEKAALLVK